MGQATRDRVPKMWVLKIFSLCVFCKKNLGMYLRYGVFVYTYVVYWSYIGHIRIYRIYIHVYGPKLYTVYTYMHPSVMSKVARAHYPCGPHAGLTVNPLPRAPQTSVRPGVVPGVGPASAQ